MLDIPQGTEEWIKARLGNVTASRISDVVTKTKTGWGASRANYMADLIVERLTGTQASTYTNAAMQWGTETEPQARVAYEFHRGVSVAQVGYIQSPYLEESGCSPDGLVGEDGLVELKCPQSATHIETLLGASIDKKYIFQMQWQMHCTDRKWCDWVSFDPRMPESMCLFIKRVDRDDELLSSLWKDVDEFLKELREKVDRLRSKYA